MKVVLDDVVQLLERFVGGVSSGPEFEQSYIALWHRIVDDGVHLGSAQGVVENLFLDVDAYCADPALRDAHDIDEDELKKCVTRALKDIEQAKNLDS